MYHISVRGCLGSKIKTRIVPTTSTTTTIMLCPHEVEDIIAQIFIFCKKHAQNKWAINYKVCLFVSVFYLDWPLIFLPQEKRQKPTKCGAEIFVIPGQAILFLPSWHPFLTNSSQLTQQIDQNFDLKRPKLSHCLHK